MQRERLELEQRKKIPDEKGAATRVDSRGEGRIGSEQRHTSFPGPNAGDLRMR